LYRFLLSIILAVTLSQATELENALIRAQVRGLADSRYWHLLLHMPSDVSELDDPAFFLAPDGKTEAAAELNATLKALYGESRLDDNATGCRFPARSYWLKAQLQLENLPELRCEAYDTLVR
jgi:hypothetical protein